MRCAMIKLTPLDCARRRRARTRDQRENAPRAAAAAQYYTLYMQTTRCLLLGRSLRIFPAERERERPSARRGRQPEESLRLGRVLLLLR